MRFDSISIRQTGLLIGAALSLAALLALSGCTDTKADATASVTERPEGMTFQPSGTCDRPVYLTVSIEKLDRTMSADYGKALRDTQIVRRHGGTYLAVSPPDRVMEGDWASDSGYVIERYPCREALEAMWDSEEYQTVLKPLREGSGIYTVYMFEEYRPQ